MTRLQLFGITGLGEVEPGDDLAALLLQALRDAGEHLLAGDVLVVSSKVVSKAEGRVVAAADRETQITAETVRLVAARRTPGGLSRIVQAAAGPVMAAAGVDASNVSPGTVLLLPKDPDASARTLRARLRDLTGTTVGVIISDTAGRAWRDGQIDFALGAAGVAVTDDLRGAVDTHGQSLEVTVRALVDELAAAADLVKGKLDGVPAAVVRGSAAAFTPQDGPGAAALLRPVSTDWFRHGHVEAVRAALGVGAEAVEPPRIPPDDVPTRLARALTVALHGRDPWAAPGSDRTDAGPAPAADQPAPVTYRVQAEAGRTVVTQFGGGTEAAASLGALAQRLAVAAWSEDLTVQVSIDFGAPCLHVTAADATPPP